MTALREVNVHLTTPLGEKETCRIDGCYGNPEWEVTSPDMRTLYVCGDCRDELIAVHGYRLVFQPSWGRTWRT